MKDEKVFGRKSVLISKTEFDSEPVYNKEFLKTKIKSHDNEVKDFYDKKFLREAHNLAVINLDSALKKDDNYYLQVLLKECKYTEKKLIRHINYSLSNSLMMNKLKLVGLVFQKIYSITYQTENAHKKSVLYF